MAISVSNDPLVEDTNGTQDSRFRRKRSSQHPGRTPDPQGAGVGIGRQAGGGGLVPQEDWAIQMTGYAKA